ncbi:MAG: C39 family peptidase [Chloroflexi bacterium]|nr:C39 family peptidase [Chloroflexota bacterium]
MIDFIFPTTARAVLRAVLIGAGIGTAIAALIVFAFANALPDLVVEKYHSLRYRVAEYLPQPTIPAFVPTPLATAESTNQPTTQQPHDPATQRSNDPTTQRPNHPIATLSPTRRPTSQRSNHQTIQPTVMLRGFKHDYQRWNNCGPTTLGMMLSYFGRADTQAEIAAFTKPNYDDRNVRPDELSAYVDRTGLHAIIRVNGTLDELKTFLSNGIPVIVETALVKQPQGWMGHYRLLSGYDAKQFSTLDSYDGPSVKITFDDLDKDWRAFNRLYLVVYTEDQAARVRAIIGEAMDDRAMYTQAVTRAREEIAANPQDAFAQFNLGMSLVGLKRYAEAAAAFDKARNLGLPWRMLWYQFGPYEAYLQTKRYDEVYGLANALLAGFDGLEESHYYKGLALRAQGRADDARAEFQIALKYNKNYRDAQRALKDR